MTAIFRMDMAIWDQNHVYFDLLQKTKTQKDPTQQVGFFLTIEAGAVSFEFRYWVAVPSVSADGGGHKHTEQST